MRADDIPLDRKLLDKLADEMMFGPQSKHAEIRHQALLVTTKAYQAGYLARVAEEKPA